MNIDTMSYAENIKRAAEQVRLSKKAGRWILLGYVAKAKESSLMTINVEKEGMIFHELMDSFKDDKIQYGYIKLDYQAQGNMKLFLIHWVGKSVGENEKKDCVPHLAIIKEFMITYDSFVNGSVPLDINTKINNYLCTIPKKKCITTIPKIKLIILGEQGVGKTCIYVSYVREGEHLSVRGVPNASVKPDIMNKDVKYGHCEFTLQLWDTVGMETYKSYLPTFLRGAQVVICTYDITDSQSYTGIPKLIQTAKQYADPKAIFFLVGNKADLVTRRQVQQTKAQSFANKNDITFMECSSMTGLNILNLFENITEQVVQVYQDVLTSSALVEALQLEENTPNQDKMGSFCCRK